MSDTARDDLTQNSAGAEPGVSPGGAAPLPSLSQLAADAGVQLPPSATAAPLSLSQFADDAQQGTSKIMQPLGMPQSVPPALTQLENELNAQQGATENPQLVLSYEEQLTMFENEMSAGESEVTTMGQEIREEMNAADTDNSGTAAMVVRIGTAGAAALRSVAGNTGAAGASDPRAELAVALERAPPMPGVAPHADSGAGSAAAGGDPTPAVGLVVSPGNDDRHATAVQGGQGNTSEHHTR